MISSPWRITPEATVPQKPRKSRFGRLTYWIGKRRSIRLRSDAMCTVSRRCSSVSPWYQGMCVLASTMLSPFSAEIGTTRRSPISRRVAKSVYSFLIRSKTSSDQPTRSILLMATTTCLIPSSDTMKLCRRVCCCTPWRASMRMMARSQLDAPVAMLRVYCSWPGRVGDDELAPAGREVAVGDVDRDALLALGLEAVRQQRQVDLAAGRALALAVAAAPRRAGPRRSAWCRRAAGR